MIAALQWIVSTCPNTNLGYLERQLAELREQYPSELMLVCLPEGFACFDAPPETLKQFSNESREFIEAVCI